MEKIHKDLNNSEILFDYLKDKANHLLPMNCLMVYDLKE